MDPNEYAMSFDSNIRRTLASSAVTHKIRNQLLDRCLQYQKQTLSQEETQCIEREYLLISQYLEKAKQLK